jgi:hypothetical protein
MERIWNMRPKWHSFGPWLNNKIRECMVSNEGEGSWGP